MGAKVAIGRTRISGGGPADTLRSRKAGTHHPGAAAAAGILKPDFTTFIAQSLGIGRGADVIIYASILILFYLLFRTHILIENLRHEVTQVIRALALKDLAKGQKKSGA